MAKDKYEVLGPLYGEIGLEVADIVGGDPDGAFLYAEVGEGWVYASVFKDEGPSVRYFDPSSELSDLLLEAWEEEEPDKRWAVMEYEIKGTRFDARFLFPEEIDPKMHASDRRPIVLKRRYGDKPVIYPPIPDHFLELKADED
jgi:hypothetical protein